MYFKFNNIPCERFNLILSESNHLSKPKKKIELISIPGATGDLIIDDGTYENFELVLTCYIDATDRYNLKQILNEMHEWLNVSGYKRLVLYDGTQFDGVFIGNLEPEKIATNFYSVELKFSTIIIPEVVQNETLYSK